MQLAFDADALTLPPPYRARRQDDPAAVLTRAVDLAPKEGAGTMVYGESPETLAFAVVLEPEMPLAEARVAFHLGMAAVAAAVAAHCPPERIVRLRWPDKVVYDAARLGRGRLVWPERCAETEQPGWLVFGAELVAGRPGLDAPGRVPGTTSLAEEEIGPARAIVESFAGHLMLGCDTLVHIGLDRAVERYLARLGTDDRQAPRRIARNGDLVETGPGGVEIRRALLTALAAAGPAPEPRRS